MMYCKYCGVVLTEIEEDKHGDCCQAHFDEYEKDSFDSDYLDEGAEGDPVPLKFE